MMKIKLTTSWIVVVFLTMGINPVLCAGAYPQAEINRRASSLASGANILWEEPRDIEQRDLFYGPGGQQGAPDPESKFTFIRRSTSGTQKKIIVKDDRGRE